MLEENSPIPPFLGFGDEDDRSPGAATFESLGIPNSEDEWFTAGLEKLQQHNWSQELAENGFNGDKTRGEILMDAFSQGCGDVLLFLKKNGHIPEHFIFPEVKIVPKTDTSVRKSRYNHSVQIPEVGSPRVISGDIFVQVQYVENYSNIETDLLITGFSGIQKDLILSQGTNLDLFYLAGVEEAAHSVKLQKKPITEDAIDHSTVSVAEYDAQDHEYHGLGWQIRTIMNAEAAGKLDPEHAKQILEPLKNRLQSAIAFRKSAKRVT